ncbi:MAG: hypothetical protein WKF82_05375 [Nocardioidaceae bacterium]
MVAGEGERVGETVRGVGVEASTQSALDVAHRACAEAAPAGELFLGKAGLVAQELEYHAQRRHP